MGTRHIVEVIKDKKTAIRQYGQWDGDAATAAYHLRNFIKEIGAQTIRELIDLTQVQGESDRYEIAPDLCIGNAHEFHVAESLMLRTEISEYIDRVLALGFVHTYLEPDEKIALIPAVVERFGLAEAVRHYMLTRDTGYKILDVIGVFSCFRDVASGKVKIPVWLEDEELNPGRKIIIDLDNETFTCNYFDDVRTWSFGKLPTLAVLRKIDHA